MKQIKKSIFAIIVVAFIGNFNALAQDSKVTQDTREVLTDAKQVKKERTKAELQELKADAKIKKETAKDQVHQIEDEMSSLEKKLKLTTDPKERESLELEVKKLKAGKQNVKSTVKTEIKREKEGAKTEIKEIAGDKRNTLQKEVAVKKNVKADVPTNLEWQEYRVVKKADAKQMLQEKKRDLDDREAYISSSRNQIDVAKRSLQQRIKDGKIAKEDIAKYQARIANAEQRLANYENNVQDSKQKLDAYSNQISDMDVKN